MLMIFLPLVVSFTLSNRLPSDSMRAARSPAPSACADEAAALPLEVFTTPGCAYCARAKRFFKRNSLQYTERDVSASEAVLREMIQRASVATCLPQHQPRPACNPKMP